MFFDAFPAFYETSKTSASRERLNLRYEAIFGENRHIFAGARVLDIASHDGRWSFAAAMGAAEVTGIEARADLVEAARRSVREYGVDERTVRFVTGDVFTALDRETFDVDVVLCLGFLYHTLRYGELMSRIAALEPAHLLIDTIVEPWVRRPMVRVHTEVVDREANAAPDEHSSGRRALVGTPSLRALKLILRTYGFRIDQFSDWASLLRDNPELRVPGYARGRRVTVRCVPRRTAKRRHARSRDA